MLLFLAGCNRPPSVPSPVRPPEPAPREVTSSPLPGPGTPLPTPPTAPSPSAPPAQPRVFDESILRGREFLLEPGSEVIFPADPDLGPLESDQDVRALSERIFRDAADGAWDDVALNPRWASSLRSWVKRFSSLGPWDTVRVGKVRKDTSFLLVPFRLNRTKPTPESLTGWMVWEPDESGWRLSDIEAMEATPRTAPFDPEREISQEISSPSRR